MTPRESAASLSAAQLERIRERLGQRSGQILHHTSVYFGTLLVSKLVVFLFTLYLARTLGAAALGIFAVGVALSSFLATVGLCGLPQTAVRYMSIYRSRGDSERMRAFVGRSLLVVLITGVTLGLLLYAARAPVAATLLGRRELVEYLPAFAGAVLLHQLYQLGRETLRGLQAVSRVALIDLFGKIGSRVVVTVGFIALGYGLWAYVGGYLLSLALAAVLLFRAVRHRTGGELRSGARQPLEGEVRAFARYSLGAALVAVVIQRGDRILLGGFTGAGDVGVYDVAMMVATTLSVGLTALSAILSPVIADLYESNELEMTSVLAERANKWVTTFTFPAAACVAVFAPGIMGLFGDGFVAGWPVLAVLTAAQMIDVGMGSVGLLLSMSGHQREEFQAVGLAAGSMVVLDLLFIPLWGTMGAALAFLVAVTLQNVFRLVRVRRLVGIDPVGPDFRSVLPLLALGAAGILGLQQWSMRAMEGWWAPLVLTSVLGYAFSFGLVWWISSDEVDRVILSQLKGVAGALLSRGR